MRFLRMSCWVFMVALLLSLFSATQATASNCEELTKPLILKHDNKSIMGKWIFLEGIADHLLFTNILKTVNSSWIEFRPSAFENTVILSQGNMLNGKCEFKTINSTVKDGSIYATHNETSTEGKFLPSCSDCITMSFISSFKNETIKSLYFFKKDNKPNEFDLAMYWKQAECLGFRRESQYSYDGVTEFCSPDLKNMETAHQ
ncbi:saxitoxin and tetrodotoxin-binding protein 2 [Paramisgurnus dabryanus]|uniref:saxitoxin and tetrodotoxin-binding protein 2 n=1 Tax=Paramisgurnus dabryanus TaxID=90735 RepID=UPI0031F43B59